MSFKDIVAGKKTARPIRAGYTESKKTGNKAVAVEFAFDENGQQETLIWKGWLSEKAIEHTSRTLTDVLGFNLNDEAYPEGHPKAGEWKDPNAIAYGVDVSIVVEMETYEGKTRPRIKYINKLGSGNAYKSLEPETVKGSPEIASFKAQCMAIRQAAGTAVKSSVDASSDIPF